MSANLNLAKSEIILDSREVGLLAESAFIYKYVTPGHHTVTAKVIDGHLAFANEADGPITLQVMAAPGDTFLF